MIDMEMIEVEMRGARMRTPADRGPVVRCCQTIAHVTTVISCEKPAGAVARSAALMFYVGSMPRVV